MSNESNESTAITDIHKKGYDPATLQVTDSNCSAVDSYSNRRCPTIFRQANVGPDCALVVSAKTLETTRDREPTLHNHRCVVE